MVKPSRARDVKSVKHWIKSRDEDPGLYSAKSACSISGPLS
jgi:hypothetical protein